MTIHHRTLLSNAWSGMLAVLIAKQRVDPLRHTMARPCTELSATLAPDPGVDGLRVLLHQVLHVAGGEGLGRQNTN